MVLLNVSAVLRLSLALLLAAPLGACSSSPWKSEFHASGEAAPLAAAPSSTSPVRIREVPWERIQATLGRLQADRAASDIHPDDWDAQKKAAARADLLRGLQISEDPRTVSILGRAEFRSTDHVPLPAEDKDLAAFARQIGATTVIWSDSYLGKADVIRYEPVTEWRSGSWDHWNSGVGGRGRSQGFSENSTIWVPISVQADERAFIAYFLRENSPPASASAATPLNR